MRFFNIICSLYFLFTFFSCENNSILPKQDAYLRIEFNEPNYLIHKSQNSKINFLYNASSSSIESISARTINLDYKKKKPGPVWDGLGGAELGAKNSRNE